MAGSTITADPSTGKVIIGTLAQVAAAAREPDCAELLKAAISAGSLAKAGPNLHNNQYNYQYVVDASLDTAVIQILANLIDQQSPDSFSTAITIGNNTLYGAKDLPYFYRYHFMSVTNALPSPNFSNGTPSLTFQPDGTGTTTTGILSGPSTETNINGATVPNTSWNVSWSFPVTTGTTTTTQSGAYLDPARASGYVDQFGLGHAHVHSRPVESTRCEHAGLKLGTAAHAISHLRHDDGPDRYHHVGHRRRGRPWWFQPDRRHIKHHPDCGPLGHAAANRRQRRKLLLAHCFHTHMDAGQHGDDVHG
jgi:hypothetical protein